MHSASRAYIRGQIDGMLTFLRMTDTRLTPGEIYDAIAQELERRCRAVIDMQSQQNTKHTGLASKGEEQDQ